MNKQQGQYPVSQSDIDELYRLSIQDELLNERFFYQPADLKSDARILDVACGTGGWIRKIARLYPESSCVGIDKNSHLLDRARVLADNANLKNVTYIQKDFFDLARIPLRRFDVIYMRCASWFLGAKMQEVFAQCQQRLMPGGTFAVSEFVYPFVTNSEAMELFSTLFFDALKQRGTALVSIKNVPFLFRDAGLANIQSTSAPFSMSYGAPGREGFVTDFQHVLNIFKPLVLSSGMSEDEYEELAQTVKHDMDDPEYQSSTDFVTITGQRV